MKKLTVILLAAILLAGCTQTNPEQTTAPATEPTTKPTTAPTTAPTNVATQPMETTELPTEETRQPWPDDGRYVFVFEEERTEWKKMAGSSELVKGCLYLADEVTMQIYLISDRAVYTDPERSGGNYSDWIYRENATHVFYVLNDEPNKLYSTPKEKPTQQTVIYESEAGPITDLKNGVFQYENTVLQWIEGHRQYVWFDILTATAEVRMKQVYILSAYTEYSGTSTTTLSGKQYLHNENRIYFYGKPSPDAELSGYIYYRDVGRCTPVHY